jgi:endonuclease YncB( thermonuclease family)
MARRQMKFPRAITLALLLAAIVGSLAYAQERRPSSSSAKAADCVATMGVLPKPFDGVAFAITGDTLAVVGLRPHVRIWGIQAPALRDKDKQETVPGMRARAALDDLLAPAGHKIHCNPDKWDRDCRVVALCVAKTTDIGGRMIDNGMAYGFDLHDVDKADVPLSLSYAESEAAARKEMRGLWPEWLGKK